MARIRSVHPTLFSDEAFASCSLAARLLIIGLWTEADDKGVFEWKPLTLKMRIFPADAFDIATMSALLDELATANIVKHYAVDGKGYGAIRNFRRWQRPKKPNDVHPLPAELLSYVALSSSSEPVGNQCGTGGEISFQMEDVGCRREEGGGRREKNPQPRGKNLSR